MTERGYDYVIVGGGSAGCVLASRLSENDAVRVLLLEAGGKDNHPLIHMPVGFAKMTTGPHTWGLTTAPQKHANDREIPYAQARVIGGGSSINAEVFTRGNPADFDRWAEKEGCDGWAFADIQKYFLRSEGNSILAGDWHGTDGPQGVSNVPTPQPMTRAFVQSCQELGIPYNPDFNGPVQAGAGVYQTTTLNARRCSTARGYLKPVLNRKNLTVETGCQVQRVLVSGGRATGVEYAAGGQIKRAIAQQEVIVTSGAVGTPKLMMLSGIGPAAHLREHGIEVVHDLPGVGENLNDHFGIDIVAELNGHDSLDKYNKPHGRSGPERSIFCSIPDPSPPMSWKEGPSGLPITASRFPICNFIFLPVQARRPACRVCRRDRRALRSIHTHCARKAAEPFACARPIRLTCRLSIRISWPSRMI